MFPEAARSGPSAFPVRFLLLGALSILAATSGGAAAVEQIYRQHCAICHGDALEGGLGGSLVDGEWTYGGSPEEIYASIHEGHPEMDMPAFAGELSEAEIQALVVYLREREGRERMRETPPTETEGIVETRHHRYRVETVVGDGLTRPWSLAFLPDGRMLVAERPGSLRMVEDGRLLDEPVAGLPEIHEHGQGGLMEVALHPDYPANGWIYLAYCRKAAGGDRYFTALARGRLREGRWMDNETVFDVPERFYGGAGVHFGVRLVFHPDNHLYFGIGDRGVPEQAQDLGRPNGKIHRIHLDGRVPEDNPFVGREDAFPTIWTYGNRNPQGLDLHPATGKIWSTEHGPRGGDELNLIAKGRNYGWPEISYGMNYNGTPFTGRTRAEGMEQPVEHWTPSLAVCGIDFYEGDAFPAWRHDLFITSLRAEELWRYRLKDGAVEEKELIAMGLGRIRDVHSGPDGCLYLVLNGPDHIVRLAPPGDAEAYFPAARLSE